MRAVGGWLLIGAMVAGPARAQSGGTAADTSVALAKSYPSASAATWYSITFTVIPAVVGTMIYSGNGDTGAGSVLAFAGVVAGPATGYWYGHVGGKSWSGMVIRTGGIVLAAAGLAARRNNCGAVSVDCMSTTNPVNAALVGGSLLVLGSAIYDMATVGRKVSAHNAAMLNASIVPIFQPSRRRVGLEVVVGF